MILAEIKVGRGVSTRVKSSSPVSVVSGMECVETPLFPGISVEDLGRVSLCPTDVCKFVSTS